MSAPGTPILTPTITPVNGLDPVALAGDTLYAEQTDRPLCSAARKVLRDAFASNLAHLERYLNRPTSHAFVPLGSPEQGHHVAFQGPFSYADLEPFFHVTPNALTVVDGRPYGFLRFRLIRLEGETIHRVAEIEVSLAHDAPSVGFELVWAASDCEPLRVVRFVQRKGEEAVNQVSRLIAEWGAKFRLLKSYPELQPSLVLQ